MEEKVFYKVKDLAKLLEVSIVTIHHCIKAGRLRAYKIGREFRIDKTELEAFLIKSKH